jgi:uncharacterized repeat protein (TIGR01451 family)
MVGGGATTKAGILQKYDSDGWVRYVYAQYFHITRDDIVKMQVVHIHMTSTTLFGTSSLDNKTTYSVNYSLVTSGRRPNGSAGEKQYDAAGAPIYVHNLKTAFRTSPITALYCGAETCGRYKAIAMDCGNPIMDSSEANPLPPPPPPPPAPVPTASCNLLTLLTPSIEAKKSAKVTISGFAANGATISAFKINFGDGTVGSYPASTELTAEASHAYAKDGNYTITGTAITSLGEKNGYGCTKTIAVTAIPVPCSYTNDYPATDSRCKPCAENAAIPATDAKCTPDIIRAKKAANLTQKISDANGTTAKSGDTIEYTLTTTNNSKALASQNYVVTESVADILDYADPVDLGGATLGTDHIMRWPSATIRPSTALVRKFTFKIKDPIPTTNTPKSDAGTFDMKMVNVYGDTVVINVTPPPAKIIENTNKNLPNTGPGTSLIIGFFLTALVGYFFARARLMSHELELVKVEYTSGGGF